MGFIGSLLQAAVDTVSLPVDVTIDVLEGGKNKRTTRKVERIGTDFDDAFNGDSFL